MRLFFLKLWTALWPATWRVGAVIALLVFVTASYEGWEFFFSEPDHVQVGEYTPPDETLRFAQIVDNGEHIVNNTRDEQNDGVYRRDAHAKTHGCAVAGFSVKKLTNNRLLHGLFSREKDYKAWIRFSSGDYGIQSDWVPDARGMAIKVLGVPGQKLLEGEKAATTQDFLMIDYPVFFVSSVDDYVKLTTLQSKGQPLGWFFGAAALPPHRGGRLNPLNWRMRAFRLGLGVLGAWSTPYPHNLLDTRFYSMSAYKLGDAQYVKYSAKPVACKAGGGTPSSWSGFGGNTLHDDLRDQLNSGTDYCFDFMVQLQAQGPGIYMPVEDPTVLWKESVSPFITVATITMRKQNVDVAIDNAFCENLSFTPWHSLPAHQPVGALNRARKVVYQNIARYRRCSNGKYFGEPNDDGTMAFTTQSCEAHGFVPEVKPGTNPVSNLKPELTQ